MTSWFLILINDATSNRSWQRSFVKTCFSVIELRSSFFPKEIFFVNAPVSMILTPIVTFNILSVKKSGKNHQNILTSFSSPWCRSSKRSRVKSKLMKHFMWIPSNPDGILSSTWSFFKTNISSPGSSILTSMQYWRS